MDLAIIVLIEYFITIILTIIFALIIIDKLYISKRISKVAHFHHYNDLFSWVMFFFNIAIICILRLIALFITLSPLVSFWINKITILLYFFPVWNKIIHLEKVMNKITYEKHYFAGMIPLALVLILGFAPISNFVLIVIFLLSTILPYFVLFIYSKHITVKKKKMIIVLLGVTFIIIGFVLIPQTFEFFGVVGALITSLINISSVSSLIIGDLLIFSSFRRELNSQSIPK
jgi:hypothetical protein